MFFALGFLKNKHLVFAAHRFLQHYQKTSTLFLQRIDFCSIIKSQAPCFCRTKIFAAFSASITLYKSSDFLAEIHNFLLSSLNICWYTVGWFQGIEIQISCLLLLAFNSLIVIWNHNFCLAFLNLLIYSWLILGENSEICDFL